MTFRDLVLLVEAASKERLQIISNQFDMDLKDVQQLSQYDPTDGKYLTWIVKQVKNKTLRFPEDGDKVKERLTQFQQLSRKPAFNGNKDINQYKTYGDLAKTIDDNLNVKTKGEIIRAAETEGAKLLDTQEPYKLYLVTTSEAAAKLFRNTEWCVKDPKFFNDKETYNPREFYYVTKNDKPYALLHGNSEQFMDVYDNPYYWERLPILEPIILKYPSTAAEYAKNVIKGRWKEAEPIIMKDPGGAVEYAEAVIQGRWKEAEPYIMKGPGSAKWYAQQVIQGRWKEAEPIIIKDPYSAYSYAKDVIKGRWKEAEPIIIKDPKAAARYARDVINGRWKEAEPLILTDPKAAVEYAKDVINVIQWRWHEAEDIIMKDPDAAGSYAKYVIKGRWPIAEPTILKDLPSAFSYAASLEDTWPQAEKLALKNPDVFEHARVITDYCVHGRHKRWKEAEPYIKANGYWDYYKDELSHNRWIGIEDFSEEP